MTTSIIELDDGARIWFKAEGSGPPLVQLHGSAFGHRNFERLSPLLVDHFTVIDLDLPGFGQSTGGTTGGGMAALADQVAEFVRRLGHDQVHLHGTSFGGMIAFSLAARHPELVDRLVLSCFLARYDEAARIMRATWKRAAMESGMEAVADLTAVAGFARSYYDRPEAAAQLASMRAAFSHTIPAAFVASTEVIEGTDLSGLTSQITAKALLIAGAEDNMTPFAPSSSGVGMAHIASQLAGAETIVLPDCGHYLVIEAATEAAELIIEFLERTAVPT